MAKVQNEKPSRKERNRDPQLTSKYFALALPIMKAKARIMLERERNSARGSNPVCDKVTQTMIT
jgi:hypothetical protein